MRATYFLACLLHAFIAGVATSLAIAVIPELAGTAVFCGLMSLAYALCWAVRPPTEETP